MHGFVQILFFLSITTVLSAQDIEYPVTVDGVRAELFAQEPLIKHPIGICFDHRGRLLAVESHTHFRPDNYQGPAGDRILWLKDTDDDGQADEAVVLFDNLQNACLIKPHPNGWLYVTTRNEVLRLRDDDGDGNAETVERKLAWLDTTSTYPHNGLSGLTFGAGGSVFIGMGENLGAAYTIRGRDGSSVSDEGEGGSIWLMSASGENLRRFARGFWNPFGLEMIGQHLFATDNDPSGSPPSRLHWVIGGGDYGYIYRYGRSGKHPFVAWNGELPGTIPMFAGIGEAPCDLAAASTGDGLFITSWVDHWIEYIDVFESPDASGQPARGVSIRGGAYFRPVGLAWAPSGELYISDWVERSYQLHGKGRIWRVADPLKARLRPFERFVTYDAMGPNPNNPWAYSAEIERKVKELAGQEPEQPLITAGTIGQRCASLLTAQRSAWNNRHAAIGEGLGDPARQVKLLALRWLAEERVGQFLPEVEAMLDSETDPDLFLAALTALTRIQGHRAGDKQMAALLKARVLDENASPETRLAALRIFPEPNRAWKAAELESLLWSDHDGLRGHALALLTQLDDQRKTAVLERAAADDRLSADLRRFALVGLAGREVERDAARDQERPVEVATRDHSLTEWMTSWMDFLKAVPGEPNIENGRFVFFHPQLGGCAICHQIGGIGRAGGPDLSRIGEMSTEHILVSVLNPWAEVAPQYQPWSIQTTDGRDLTVFQLAERGGTHLYADIEGNEITLKIEQIAHREQIPGSLMPPGSLAKLSDSEVRDLIAYLDTCRPDVDAE